jgi:hypothetical protein
MTSGDSPDNITRQADHSTVDSYAAAIATEREPEPIS